MYLKPNKLIFILRLYATWISYNKATASGTKPEGMLFQRFNFNSRYVYLSSPGYDIDRFRAVVIFEDGIAVVSGGTVTIDYAARPALCHRSFIMDEIDMQRKDTTFFHGSYTRHGIRMLQ